MFIRSYSLRMNFQPLRIKISLISAPWLMPISKYILPPLVNHMGAFFAIDLYAANPLSGAYRAIFGSCVAPMSTRLSLCAIYGGFETIISNVWLKLYGWSKDVRIVFICFDNCNVWMFLRATRRARRDLSTATPVAPSRFFINAQMMQPVPVPKSSICGDGLFLVSFNTADTNVSVSGRGSNVCRLV